MSQPSKIDTNGSGDSVFTALESRKAAAERLKNEIYQETQNTGVSDHRRIRLFEALKSVQDAIDRGTCDQATLYTILDKLGEYPKEGTGQSPPAETKGSERHVGPSWGSPTSQRKRLQGWMKSTRS